MSVRGDRRSSNELESESNGKGLSHLCWFARASRESIAKGAGGRLAEKVNRK